MARQTLTEKLQKPNCLEIMFEEWPQNPPERRFRGMVYDRVVGELLFACETPKATRTRKWVYRFVTENTDFRRVE